MTDPETVDLSDDFYYSDSFNSSRVSTTGMKMVMKTSVLPHVTPQATSIASDYVPKRARMDPIAVLTEETTDSENAGLLNGEQSYLELEMRPASTANVDLSWTEADQVTVVGAYSSVSTSPYHPFCDDAARSGDSIAGNLFSEPFASCFSDVLVQCESCQQPISNFGRFVPCYHALCLNCASRLFESIRQCFICQSPISSVLQVPVGALCVCDTITCRRTFLGRSELHVHIQKFHRTSELAHPHVDDYTGGGHDSSESHFHEASSYSADSRFEWNCMPSDPSATSQFYQGAVFYPVANTVSRASQFYDTRCAGLDDASHPFSDGSSRYAVPHGVGYSFYASPTASQAAQARFTNSPAHAAYFRPPLVAWNHDLSFTQMC